MATDNNNIKFKNESVKLLGPSVGIGEVAPEFKLTGGSLEDVCLKDYQGKVLILSVVPSLDTPVCSIQTKRFNEELEPLPDDIAVLTVSLDLPFAQLRWCSDEDVTRVKFASDYKYREFGNAYGTLVENVGLLARAIFVISKEGKIAHVEYVDEITEEPNYLAALETAKAELDK